MNSSFPNESSVSLPKKVLQISRSVAEIVAKRAERTAPSAPPPEARTVRASMPFALPAALRRPCPSARAAIVPFIAASVLPQRCPPEFNL